jgi:ribosomal protein S18 acetylase RimI-like enzyme
VDLHVPSGAPALDLHLQRYVRAVTARGRDVERVGPFQATFDRHANSTFLNYAIPDDGAEPTLADIAALAEVYRRRARVPRLEYLPAAAPKVEAALLAGGFSVEARLSLMTCGAGDVVDLAPSPGITIAVPETDEELRGMRLAQHAAFGVADSEIDDDDVGRQRASLAAGTLALLARDDATGAIVGGGVATVPSEGVTEIAGIGVRETHRRRGIAGAITAGLARAAFSAGLTTAWLTPGHEGAQRVYARAGFADTTTMLHIWMPD